MKLVDQRDVMLRVLRKIARIYAKPDDMQPKDLEAMYKCIQQDAEHVLQQVEK
jgi:hypothetical protein